MASIKKRPDGRWRARYVDPDGRERARHFGRKQDAQDWLDEQTTSMQTGTWVDPKAGKVTFREYAEQWRSAQAHRPNTAAAVSSALKIWAFPAFGDRAISSIRRSDVQALVTSLSQPTDKFPKGRSASTIRTVYQHVRAVFRSAELDRVIARSPCQRIALPKVERTLIEPLDTKVVHALENAMPDRLAAMVPLMAATGLRPGEAAGLTVDRIDFLRKKLVVDKQLLQKTRKLGPLKTSASYRTVPLPRVAVDKLAAHLAEFPAGEDGLVFTKPDGTKLNRDKVMIAFKRAVEKARAPEGTTLHDLRHYYASLLIRHGESVKVVQSRLGHASAVETLNVYSHLWPDSDDRTRTAVDDVLGLPSGIASGIISSTASSTSPERR